MKPVDLILHCYAEHAEGQWTAVCLNLSLAAQADTLDEAMQGLDIQIRDYVYDAVVGEDRDFAGDLLPRRSPLNLWLKYYWHRLLSKWHSDTHFRGFTKPIPLVPAIVGRLGTNL